METCPYVCPLCHAPLYRNGGSYQCPQRHTYDIARRGYVNLLPGHLAGQHGDNRLMVEARRRFLEAGYYAPLRRAIGETVAALFPTGGDTPRLLLDAGCGECYYTEEVVGVLQKKGISCQALGIDISRNALILGARRHTGAALAVASLYHLPLADASLDLLYESFAPFCREEFTRVLRPGGHMLLVIPGKMHLYGLKEVLYDAPYENEEQDTAIPGFSLLSRQEISYPVTIQTAEELEALLTMTPYFYRTEEAKKANLGTHAPLDTPLSFVLLLYQRL